MLRLKIIQRENERERKKEADNSENSNRRSFSNIVPSSVIYVQETLRVSYKRSDTHFRERFVY